MTDEEKNRLLDHDYDGIQEYDNMLPRWWINIFYATIIFAVGYFAYYHLGGGGKSPTEIFEEEQHAIALNDLAAEKKEITFEEKDLQPLLKDQKALNAGAQIFGTRCVSCHGVGGGGGVGPNLTDDYWLHGGKPNQIAKTISTGVLDKGMIAWGTIMKREEILNVAAYVVSLRGTHPSNPKTPQGIKEQP